MIPTVNPAQQTCFSCRLVTYRSPHTGNTILEEIVTNIVLGQPFQNGKRANDQTNKQSHHVRLPVKNNMELVLRAALQFSPGTRRRSLFAKLLTAVEPVAKVLRKSLTSKKRNTDNDLS